MNDLRPIAEKVEELIQAETERLLANCTENQRAFAQRLIDAQRKARGSVDWRALHDLARRTLLTRDTSQEVTR